MLRRPTFTYNGIDRHDGTVTYGGYSDSIVVRDRFVLSIPNGLDPAGAAPLLCAGITTWSPLHRWNVGPGSKVAVIGLGGLGHMALKLAKALGADVSLFTRSPGKEEDAFRLGADHVVLSNDPAQMAAVAGRFDVIIDTVPYDHDINPYMPTLALEGVLVLVGYLGPLGTPVNAGALCADAAPSRAHSLAAYRKPSKCWTSAGSTASSPMSRSLPSSRSTKPMNAC